MKTMQKTALTLLAAAYLGTAAVAVADVRINAYDDGKARISTQGDDIVITALDDSEARITDAGELVIHGEKQALNRDQQALVRQYAGQVHDLERQGLRIGSQGVHLAIDVLGQVFTGLLQGDMDDKEIDKNARARAAGFEDSVRGMCDDMKALEQLQGRLAASLAAFKPYAVISGHSVNECYDGLKEHHEV